MKKLLLIILLIILLTTQTSTLLSQSETCIAEIAAVDRSQFENNLVTVYFYNCSTTETSSIRLEELRNGNWETRCEDCNVFTSDPITLVFYVDYGDGTPLLEDFDNPIRELLQEFVQREQFFQDGVDRVIIYTSDGDTIDTRSQAEALTFISEMDFDQNGRVSVAEELFEAINYISGQANIIEFVYIGRQLDAYDDGAGTETGTTLTTVANLATGNNITIHVVHASLRPDDEDAANRMLSFSSGSFFPLVPETILDKMRGEIYAPIQNQRQMLSAITYETRIAEANLQPASLRLQVMFDPQNVIVETPPISTEFVLTQTVQSIVPDTTQTVEVTIELVSPTESATSIGIVEDPLPNPIGIGSIFLVLLAIVIVFITAYRAMNSRTTQTTTNNQSNPPLDLHSKHPPTTRHSGAILDETFHPDAGDEGKDLLTSLETGYFEILEGGRALNVLLDEYMSDEIPIFQNSIKIGRNKDICDIVIERTEQGSTISRVHCEISLNSDDDQFYIQDLNSKYGTFVDGEQLEPKTNVRIVNNAIISLGQPENDGLKLRFVRS